MSPVTWLLLPIARLVAATTLSRLSAYRPTEWLHARSLHAALRPWPDVECPLHLQRAILPHQHLVVGVHVVAVVARLHCEDPV